MQKLHVLAGMLLLGLTIGCKAQTATNPSSDANRRIEVKVRARYDLPPDVDVTLGQRTPSKFAGYQSLPVTISKGNQKQVVNFLVSDDNTKLVHMDTMDVATSPADTIAIAGRPIRGNPDAKVTVIVFDDLECPFCARMNADLFPGTLEHYKDQVRYIYKDDPLSEIHPWAMHAAVDANCLAEQNPSVYWTYVDYLHAHGDEISGPDRNLQKSYASLDRIAEQEGTLAKLDSNKLMACIAKQDETKILAERKEADALQIDGTPALFVNGERINGAVPREQLWTVIDRAIRDAGEQPPPEPQTPKPAAPAAKPTVAK
ncbi:MAG: DsbA family protein [Acidobacteriota bacterium]